MSQPKKIPGSVFLKLTEVGKDLEKLKNLKELQEQTQALLKRKSLSEVERKLAQRLNTLIVLLEVGNYRAVRGYGHVILQDSTLPDELAVAMKGLLGRLSYDPVIPRLIAGVIALYGLGWLVANLN
tara:strand:- start:187 stop:564 length:378 start_codon:yes stop_codon:yes gene_type:complete